MFERTWEMCMRTGEMCERAWETYVYKRAEEMSAVGGRAREMSAMGGSTH